ncbi:uncharacterized protein [Henckelia pumila]|uniref:uncharacterized protein n=1 Tax=Henckelia pumila TaxID=405737 RepID=UPI003C6E4B3E
MAERKKEIKHFGHEHRLIFNESDEINPLSCNACGLRMLSSPCYMCTIQGCSFYLHEPCTRLPHKLTHSSWYTHEVCLLAKPNNEDCRCIKCGELCKNFTYHCDECGGFNLHPLCSSHPLDIQIKHVSHKQHPMVAFRKESLLLCDICGREHKGFFFACHQCNFLIHQDCASLPSFLRVERHRHPLSLTYSDALQAMYPFIQNCVICEKDTSRLFGAYVCLRCDDMAHVDCAVSAMENQGEILHLPPALYDELLLSLIMRIRLEENTKDGETLMLEKYHSTPHSLTSNDETVVHDESVCNACIRHIAAPPYYSCTQSANCDFLLHKFCADLPLVSDDLFGRSRDLVFPRRDEFFSLFFCELCLRLGNGFGYSYSSSYGGSDIFHVECGLAPWVIEHDSHKQHPLIRSGYKKWLEDIRSCCDKINPSWWDFYSCTQCRFTIHIRCALLPKTVKHKFDQHPLTLITDSDMGDDHFCEFCEKDINPSYWFYRCMECDNSFHVECIPSTGKYSRIKFGGTVVFPAACHGVDHPLSLVRMLDVGSQTCGVCHNTIQGFKDGMALHCSQCDFWIHFKCGSESSDAKVSKPYQDDQMILNIVIGLLSPSLISFIATATTSAEAGNTLSLNYGKPSRGRMTQLKTQLRNPIKGSQTITDFMQFIKSKADVLTLMNAPIDIEDLTIKVLHGLDDDYKEFAHIIQA